MRDQRKAEEIATQRMQMLAPLLAEGLDQAKYKQLKDQISFQNGLSERTVRRYLQLYKEEGYRGLMPKDRPMPQKDPIPESVLDQAILLRREVPTRSVGQIIQILEWEGLVEKGQIKRSTLQDRFSAKGYSTRHMRMYSSSGVASRRFQQKYRNKLWHSDIKYGPYLPIGKDGSKKQVYLVTFVDDSTRFVLHGQFYPVLDQVIVEDCFRQAIMKYGAPEAVFFDNGSQYRTRWMTRACSKMGIKLLFAKPYSPEATGKVERFNRVVDGFLNEVSLENPQTLDSLNKLFWVWLEECYQNKAHSALNGQSPAMAFNMDKKPLRFLSAQTIATAFLHCEERKVDKAGCINFTGKKYEVGLPFIGCTVNVIYDPADVSEITVEYEGHAPFTAKQLVIGERTGTKPKLPEHLQSKPADSSRLLHAAAKKNSQRVASQTPAVMYRKAGDGNV